MVFCDNALVPSSQADLSSEDFELFVADERLHGIAPVFLRQWQKNSSSGIPHPPTPNRLTDAKALTRRGLGRAKRAGRSRGARTPTTKIGAKDGPRWLEILFFVQFRNWAIFGESGASQ